jgi:hypothetical protein
MHQRKTAAGGEAAQITGKSGMTSSPVEAFFI